MVGVSVLVTIIDTFIIGEVYDCTTEISNTTEPARRALH
jgi:hypothetical protein